MATDVLILNTAAVDMRHSEFGFVRDLTGDGGLALGKLEDLPDFSQEQLHEWIGQGHANAGGPGNSAPLIGRTGTAVAVAANLGKGAYGGLDAPGRLFHDTMTNNSVDMSATYIHPALPTGIAFIDDSPGADRGGILYFPSANDDFDFDRFKPQVQRLQPKVLLYMYSGISARGDANGGQDLADFIEWCRGQGCVTVVDSHTLAANPQELIAAGTPVEGYRLLEPLLPELDIFFTSGDEAKMTENTLGAPRDWAAFSHEENNQHFLQFLTGKFWSDDSRTRLFGITVNDGAYQMVRRPDGTTTGPAKVTSKFMAGEAVDLVGAGDSFRAGLMTYIANHVEKFRDGSLDFAEAIQMGNLFAALYVKAPLDDRYGNLRPFDTMLRIVRSTDTYDTFDELMAALA